MQCLRAVPPPSRSIHISSVLGKIDWNFKYPWKTGVFSTTADLSNSICSWLKKYEHIKTKLVATLIGFFIFKLDTILLLEHTTFTTYWKDFFTLKYFKYFSQLYSHIPSIRKKFLFVFCKKIWEQKISFCWIFCYFYFIFVFLVILESNIISVWKLLLL